MRRIEYFENEAYNIGYADGWNDKSKEQDIYRKETIEKACEWLKDNATHYLSIYQMIHDLKMTMEVQE